MTDTEGAGEVERVPWMLKVVKQPVPAPEQEQEQEQLDLVDGTRELNVSPLGVEVQLEQRG